MTLSDAEAARLRRIFGTDERVTPLRSLTAGPLTVAVDEGNLRWLRWHGREILRGIAFVVRDTVWGTLKPRLSDLVVTEQKGGFAVSYQATVESPDGCFVYRATIDGGADGRLRFAAQGTSPGGFTTNRTGFVVLHGLEGVVGRPLDVHHTDGGVTHTRFPLRVQPDQPAFEIARLVHEPVPGLSVAVDVSGDVFEMEDQRNWTDASFKTYVRPLSRGFPYRIAAGEQVAQGVVVQVTGAGSVPVEVAPGPIAVRWGAPDVGTLPRLGLYVDDASLQAAEDTARHAAAQAPGYLQARIDLCGGDPAGRLHRAIALAETCGCPLHLDVVIAGRSPTDELSPVTAWLRRSGWTPETLFVIPRRDLRARATGLLPPGEAAASAILAAARMAVPGVKIAGGVPTGFTELNRNPPPAGIDVVAHATQAIVHAADDCSVMETLEAFPHVVATVRSLVGAIPYRIGPATIGMLPSASASSPVSTLSHQRTPIAARDPRQTGLFAAAFALGMIATSRGVDALTLAAIAGDCGLADSAGNIVPLGATLGMLAPSAGHPRLTADHRAKGRIAAFAASTLRGPTLWLANLTGDPLDVTIDGPDCRSVWMLDEARLRQGAPDASEVRRSPHAPLRLEAYAACRVTPGPPPMPASSSGAVQTINPWERRQ